MGRRQRICPASSRVPLRSTRNSSTVQSGGNDVCAARSPSSVTPETDFRRAIEAAFAVASV
jgi:hypothetical protein